MYQSVVSTCGTSSTTFTFADWRDQSPMLTEVERRAMSFAMRPFAVLPLPLLIGVTKVKRSPK